MNLSLYAKHFPHFKHTIQTMVRPPSIQYFNYRRSANIELTLNIDVSLTEFKMNLVDVLTHYL